jgi:hypothetical protein
MRFAAYHRSVRRHVGRTGERLRCHGHLVRWALRGIPARLLAIEAVAAMDPRVAMAVRTVKRRIFGRRSWQAKPLRQR